MNEATLTKPKRKTNAYYEAILDNLLAEMRNLEVLMQYDRVEIDKLKAETQLLWEESKQIREEALRVREDSMRFRQESVRLQTETRSTLSRIRQVLA